MVKEWLMRTALMIGEPGIKALKNSRVAVFGVGGVGSYAVEALARAGVGSLVLVDFDVVDVSNINRQLQALHSTVGRVKVDVMAERLKLINPAIDVTPIQHFYAPENGDEILNQLGSPLDYVVDAIDTVTNKLDLIKRCVQGDIPLVASMGAGNKIDPTTFKVDDISKTSVCPLARVMRRELKKEGIYKGVKVVYSTEPAIKPTTTLTSQYRKRISGTISFVPAAVGLIIASVVVQELLLKSKY